MRIVKLSQSDRRTIELITERHPDIKDDLARVLQGLDQIVFEKAKQIEDLRLSLKKAKQIEDPQN